MSGCPHVTRHTHDRLHQLQQQMDTFEDKMNNLTRLLRMTQRLGEEREADASKHVKDTKGRIKKLDHSMTKLLVDVEAMSKVREELSKQADSCATISTLVQEVRCQQVEVEQTVEHVQQQVGRVRDDTDEIRVLLAAYHKDCEEKISSGLKNQQVTVMDHVKVQCDTITHSVSSTLRKERETTQADVTDLLNQHQARARAEVDDLRRQMVQWRQEVEESRQIQDRQWQIVLTDTLADQQRDVAAHTSQCDQLVASLRTSIRTTRESLQADLCEVRESSEQQILEQATTLENAMRTHSGLLETYHKECEERLSSSLRTQQMAVMEHVKVQCERITHSVATQLDVTDLLNHHQASARAELDDLRRQMAQWQQEVEESRRAQDRQWRTILTDALGDQQRDLAAHTSQCDQLSTSLGASIRATRESLQAEVREVRECAELEQTATQEKLEAYHNECEERLISSLRDQQVAVMEHVKIQCDTITHSVSNTMRKGRETTQVDVTDLLNKHQDRAHAEVDELRRQMVQWRQEVEESRQAQDRQWQTLLMENLRDHLAAHTSQCEQLVTSLRTSIRTARESLQAEIREVRESSEQQLLEQAATLENEMKTHTTLATFSHVATGIHGEGQECHQRTCESSAQVGDVHCRTREVTQGRRRSQQERILGLKHELASLEDSMSILRVPPLDSGVKLVFRGS